MLDFMDPPKQLIQLKKDLKSWESMFARKHGRKPLQEDIQNSPSEIKASYKEYQRLKSVMATGTVSENRNLQQVTKNSIVPLRPNNSIFGAQLNKKSSQSNIEKKHGGVSRPLKTFKWIKGHGFQTKETESVKDNSVKDVVKGCGITDSMIDEMRHSNVNIIDTTVPTSFPLKSLDISNDIIDPTSNICSNSINRKLKLGHGITSTWLDNVKNKIDFEKFHTTKELCIDEGFHTTDDHPHSSTDEGFHTTDDHPHSCTDSLNLFSYFGAYSNTDVSCPGSYTKGLSPAYTRGLSPSNSSCSDESISSIDMYGEDWGEDKMVAIDLPFDDCKPDNETDNTENNSKDLYQELIDNEQLPECGNNEIHVSGCGNNGLHVSGHGDNGLHVSGSGDNQIHVSGCGGRRKKLLDVDEVMNEVMQYDPPLTTVLTEKRDTPHKKSTQLIESLSQEPVTKKSATRDNFVRLNMKIKRFSRKPLQITGSRYKRQQWKKLHGNKGMESRSSGGGTCFKCGKPGHWAKNCTNKEGFKNLGKFDGHTVSYNEEHQDMFDEGEDPRLLKETGVYPTVEEACRMLHKATGNEEPTMEEDMLPDPSCYKIVEPFLELEDGKVLQNPSVEILSYLNELGYKEFRNGQSTAILQILSGVSTILVQPTGSGKSLCYQLPAYCYTHRYPGCITLVISPLISLMQDQINNLPAGIVGACIHTGLSHQQRSKVASDVTAGKIDILLMSPETLVGGATGNEWSFLASSKLPPIAFACIDEAHCLSEWSHNFRPSYLRLCKILRDTIGIKCILALTATASSSTINNMAELLNVEREHIIVGSAVPDNLIMSVSCEEDRERALVNLLHSPPFNTCDSIIVYCTRQQTTEHVAQLLRTSIQLLPTDKEPQPYGASNVRCKKRKVSWSTECYHAGLSAAQRKRNQSDFMSGRLRVLVCTVAFGMGLDKSDVRSVIHYNMPKSFESFVQEIGRAGRDGDPAYCHVFIDKEGTDLLELRRHVFTNSMDRFAIKQLINKALPSICCHSDQPTEHTLKVCHGHEVAIPIEALINSLDAKEEALLTLLCYLELQGHCNLLNPVNDTCQLKAYGGATELRVLTRKIPAIAMAVAIEKEEGSITDNSSSVNFSVTQVANRLGLASKTIYQILKDLQYSKSSSAIIEFCNIAFHLKTKRCFTDTDKDSICQQLMEKIKSREEREIERLYQLYTILEHVATTDCSNSSLKQFLSLYFKDRLTTDLLQREGMDPYKLLCPSLSDGRLLQLRADVRQLVRTHDDRAFTGRAVARILQGISSPCYPAEVWGRKVFNWRKYLDIEFNTLCKIATEEIISL